MQVKRKGKQPMIWTGDLPAKHFQARPVDLSVEFEIDAVKWLDDMAEWWKKYEKSFWAKFVPLMSKELQTIENQVVKWDAEFDKYPPEAQKALQAKLGQLTKAMGERLKKESVIYSQKALEDTMDKVDREMTKTKVVARTKLSWDILIAAGAAGAKAVAGTVALPLLGIALLKLASDLRNAFKAYAEASKTLEQKAKAVHLSKEALRLELESLERRKGDEKAMKAVLDKARGAGKKLKADADALDLSIIFTRRQLGGLDKKVGEAEKALEQADGAGGADAALAAVKEWQTARNQAVADLQYATDAKKQAEAMQSKLAAAGAEEAKALLAMAKKVDSAAEKVVKVNDAVEKGKKLLDLIQSVADKLK